MTQQEVSTNGDEVKKALGDINISRINELVKNRNLNIQEKAQFGGTVWHYLAIGSKNADTESLERSRILLEDFLKFYIDEVGSEALDLPDKLGFSPLHIAARFGNIAAIKLLVEYGADLHLTNKDEKTTKDILLERYPKLKSEFDDILKNYEAHPPAKRICKPKHLRENIKLKTPGLCLEVPTATVEKEIPKKPNSFYQKLSLAFHRCYKPSEKYDIIDEATDSSLKKNN